MDFARLVELARLFLVRAFKADFLAQHAADDERAQLVALPSPIDDPLAQDYVAWRRSVLWIAGVMLGLAFLIAVADHKSIVTLMASLQNADGQQVDVTQMAKELGKDNVELIDNLMLFNLLLKGVIATLVILAALRWHAVSRSRSLSRWAWLAALVVPLVVMAWPWAHSLDFSHLERGMNAMPGADKAVKGMFALLFALSTLLMLGPKLIGLFPGIMRSSLALKTLLPEAAAPGWLTVVFAPILIGFLLFLLCFTSQAEGSYLLLGGLLLLAFGSMNYLRRARDLVRPHTPQEASTLVRGIRHQAKLFSGAGIALVAIYLVRSEAISWLSLIHMALEAVGGILLTMLAISDITLAVLAFSQQQGAAFQDSGLRVDYERRLASLAKTGLTDLQSALGMQDLERIRRAAQAARGEPTAPTT